MVQLLHRRAGRWTWGFTLALGSLSAGGAKLAAVEPRLELLPSDSVLAPLTDPGQTELESVDGELIRERY
ncbi:MAG TPA: hypothetical protein VG713_20645, partial [Pirellulales bacterium]|nr:hypothetical protein [Pirellulales bacterium]